MSTRQTLYLLMVLVAAALGGRFWAVGNYERWENALSTHKEKDKQIFESVEDLVVRRSKFSIADGEQGFLTHFQKQAHNARMGSVTTKPKSRERSGWVDKTFTIEFEKEDARFRRSQIVNFLFNAEGLVPRMRTTSLSLRPASGGKRSKQIPSGAEREDDWRITDLVLTQRSPRSKN
ncbi:MAG: hypothetical protein HOM34_09935 [Planctomycetes bacterium]|jgi:hypothetical protein|nr:hypothetical protein [Planctomycetota bacterium]MBT4029065.1 hypothetical protein [Planctomycetota bacterium]MBT4560315.1 hypothetical protein [Planctomycetota bacterium]MBT5101774.1 hypothetical protein [Planctomycetota bacterium]MBT5121028.1 hypothetical protein [Planctomycetota bacterium]